MTATIETISCGIIQWVKDKSIQPHHFLIKLSIVSLTIIIFLTII